MDLEGIYNLENLSVLSIDGVIKYKLDIAKFGSLEHLSCQFSSKLLNINLAVSLNTICFTNFKMSNLDIFDKMTKLEKLSLYSTSLETLSGVSNLTCLKKLIIDKAPALKSLNGFKESNQAMKYLEVYNAKNLTDVASLKWLVNLKVLYLQRIKFIESLSFIKTMNDLDELVISCPVFDSDFSILDKIPNKFVLGYKKNNL